MITSIQTCEEVTFQKQNKECKNMANCKDLEKCQFYFELNLNFQ